MTEPTPLPPGPKAPVHLDADLRLALATGWRDYSEQPPECIRVFLRRSGTSWGLPADATIVAAAGDFATARMKASAIASLPGDCVVALAEPVRPPRLTRPDDDPVPKPHGGRPVPLQGRSRTLLGVIDDGCPFAHVALRRQRDRIGTRVVALWDQNGPRDDLQPNYGRFWLREELDELTRQARRPGPAEAVDEAALYRRTGMTALEHRWTHGAHVMGRAGGNLYWEGGQTGPGVESGAIELEDAAAKTDLAFVQLPREALLVVSPAAVEYHAFNGMAYLIELAKTLGYERLVITLAYENWLGPHDSTSWFEHAVDALVAQASSNGLALRVVLAAGNSGRGYGHLELPSGTVSRESTVPRQLEQGKEPLHFFLAPDTEVPTWLELWIPKAWFGSGLTLQVRAPGGHAIEGQVPLEDPCLWGTADDPLLAMVADDETVSPGTRRRVLLRFGPTRAPVKRACAPHGLWVLSLASARPLEAKKDKAHAYVVRAGLLMYQTVMARQSCFPLQRQPDKARADRSPAGLPMYQAVMALQCCLPLKGLSDKARTLSGLAGGRNVIVAGSLYADRFPCEGPLPRRFDMPDECVGPLMAAPYGGVPGARARNLIDLSAVTEDGLALPGQLGMGTRTGCVYRMTGTSVATPTVARWMVNHKTWDSAPGKAPSAASPLEWSQPLPTVRKHPQECKRGT